MSNRFPQMPIRAKYADKTTEGVSIDEALESSVKNVVVADIKAIDDDILSELKCGDIVSKEDDTGKHAYIVTFKKDNTGLCLTYADGSGYIETVSYDYTGSAWVYNSTDISNAGTKLYKHTFTINNDDNFSGTLEVINNSNQNATSNIINTINNAISIKGYGVYGETDVRIICAGVDNDIVILFVALESTLASISMYSSPTLGTDTVTPL